MSLGLSEEEENTWRLRRWRYEGNLQEKKKSAEMRNSAGFKRFRIEWLEKTLEDCAGGAKIWKQKKKDFEQVSEPDSGHSAFAGYPRR